MLLSMRTLSSPTIPAPRPPRPILKHSCCNGHLTRGRVSNATTATPACPTHPIINPSDIPAHSEIAPRKNTTSSDNEPPLATEH
ncbi:hypothetical protein FRC09_019699, partial [Ceratobasidium sp. 395]